MIRLKLIIFLLLIISIKTKAQDVSILNNRFVSPHYVYFFDKSDSTFCRYQNNKHILYDSPKKIKALFEISDKGFGYVQLTASTYKDGKLIKQQSDSIYVSLTCFGEKYIIDYYLIKNSKKSVKIDYPVMQSDTIIDYYKALTTNSSIIPFINIHSVLNFKSSLYFYDNRLTYRKWDKKFWL